MPQTSIEEQPVATALASTAAATIAAASEQLAEDSAAAFITITGMAANQAVQSGRQPASWVKQRQPLAETARLLMDNAQAVGLGAVRQQPVPADRHMIQQQPDVTAALQRFEDVGAAQDVMQLEQFRDMHLQQQPPIAPLMPEAASKMTGPYQHTDLLVLIWHCTAPIPTLTLKSGCLCLLILKHPDPQTLLLVRLKMRGQQCICSCQKTHATCLACPMTLVPNPG